MTAPRRTVREKPVAPPRRRLLLPAAASRRYDLDTYDGHPRLKARTTALAPEFAAVLLPLPGTCAEAGVDSERTTAGLAVTVRWPTRVDRIPWPATGERLPRWLGE